MSVLYKASVLRCVCVYVSIYIFFVVVVNSLYTTVDPVAMEV